MYDIDKLYLMGYTPNEDGIFQFSKKKNSSYKAISSVLKNKVMRTIWSIITDPRNVVSGSSEVTVKTVKELAAISDLSVAQKTFSPFNPMIKFIMQNENSVGKDCIGITATGNKGFSIATLYANEVLTKVAELCKEGNKLYNIWLTLSEQGIPNANEYINNSVEVFNAALILLNAIVKNGNTLANLNYECFEGIVFPNIIDNQNYTTLVSTIKSIQEKEINNPDVSQSIGELLNAAADNAKELILKKINADTDFMDLYIVGLMMGYSLSDIYRCLTQDTIKKVLNNSKRQEFINRAAVSKFAMSKELQKSGNVMANRFAHLVAAAAELSILGKLTKINQGLPSNRHFDNYKFISAIDFAISNLIKEPFDFLQFVIDVDYAKEWINKLEDQKVFLNPLAIIANHPMFMAMWRAYAIADDFITRSNSYDQAIKLLNNDITQSYIATTNKKVKVTATEDFYKTKKAEFDNAIQKGYLLDLDIQYIAPKGLKNPSAFSSIAEGMNLGVNKAKFTEEIKTLKIYIDSFIIPMLKQKFPSNKFIQHLSCSVNKPSFENALSVVWTPGINMNAINEDITLSILYSEILTDFNQLERILFDGIGGFPLITAQGSPISVTNLFYIYEVICNKSNSNNSYMQFFEDSLAESYALHHAKWLESKTASELFGFYKNYTVKTEPESYIGRIAKWVSDAKHSFYNTISNKSVLERVSDSSYVVLYNNNTMIDVLTQYNMTNAEIETVAQTSPKAFIWNGTIFINSDTAGESDLIHEFIHIAIGNLKTNNTGRKVLKDLFTRILQSAEGQQIYNELKNITVYSMLSGRDYEEEVVCTYLQNHKNELDIVAPELVTDLENKVIEALSDEDPHLSDLFESKVIKFEKLQQLRLIRDTLINNGNINKNCE